MNTTWLSLANDLVVTVALALDARGEDVTAERIRHELGKSGKEIIALIAPIIGEDAAKSILEGKTGDGE